jgi:two-component system, OmpR family, response regulator
MDRQRALNTPPGEVDEAEPRVLIVDDDEGLKQQIASYLENNGYRVETARDAPTMDHALAQSSFDVVILDLMMPGEDGLSICRRLSAQNDVAIIIMSAMGEEVDRIVGLELGADDYLPKPSNPRELLARIRAVLRRRPPGGGESAPRQARIYNFAGYQLDPARRRLKAPSGLIVLLTRGELSLLISLLDRAGEVLTRDQLLDTARVEDADVFDRAIDVQISRLRRKLGEGDRQDIIRTVRGVGYRLTAPVTRS